VVSRPLPAVKRGEVWLAALDPTVGSEIRKSRPCLIVSPDELNAYLRTATVVPMATGSRPAPYRLPVHFQGKDGLLLPDQMRTLDRRRLVRRLGAVEPATLTAALALLRELFAQ
jgi:mRNA interferase MazF